MSITDPVNDAQPPEGQGGQGDAPYAEYLNRLPEEVRGDVEPVFKDWDANTTRKFQEHSEYRKSWEPYEQAGLNQYDPEQVQNAIGLLQATPEQIVEWAKQVAEQNGLELTPQQQQTPEFQYDGYQDPQQQLEQLLEQRLGPISKQLEQFGSQFQQQQEQQRLEQAEQFVQGQLDDLAQKHGDAFNREMVERLAQNYTDDPLNAIPKAWEEWQRIEASIQKKTLQPKVGAPAPAEGGGVADVSREKISSLNDPRLAETARQYLRNQLA